MTLTLHLIMSLHLHEREPMKPVHCACRHDVCSVVYDLHNTSQDSVFERYKVRKSFLYINKSSQTWVVCSPSRGQIGYVSKQTRKLASTEPANCHFSNCSLLWVRNRDVTDNYFLSKCGSLEQGLTSPPTLSNEHLMHLFAPLHILYTPDSTTLHTASILRTNIHLKPPHKISPSLDH